MKTSLKFWIVAAMGFSIAACGGDGGGGASTPTLGITSIPKATQPKPSFASNVFQKTLHLVSARQAAAQATCQPDDFVHRFTLGDGTIWIKQAYAILDEVEFEVAGDPSGSDDGPEFGPFAVDLTATDSNVPEVIPLTVPDGNFDEIKFKIKRLEDTPVEQPVNVSNLSAFLQKVGFSANDDRRPSVWIQGVIGVGDPNTSTDCTDFKFLTDHRWSVRVPLATGTVNPNQVDAVLLFDLEGAFTSSGVTASDLKAEVGLPSPKKPLGPGFLDGRTKDDEFGTPKARLVASQLPVNMEVFTQAFGTFASDPRIDDGAVHVSGGDQPDDNPSADDLAEPIG